jgi:hypothetical protein
VTPGPAPAAPRPPAPPAPAGAETAVRLLEALGTELGQLGWAARLAITAGRPPALHVTSTSAGAGPGADIGAGLMAGDWWYFWPGAQPIARAPSEAAALVSRALRTAARPQP